MSARRILIGTVLAAGLGTGAPTADATFPGRNGRIAFTTSQFSAEDNSYTSRIISIRPDGSAPRLLATGTPEHAVYRPDGHMIAFVRPGRGIFVMRSDGSAKRRVLAGPYAEPDWAPDGRRLVVTRTSKPRGLFVWDRGRLRSLTEGSTPAWSPEGTLIAFTGRDARGRGSNISVIGSEGCCARRLARGEGPKWTPDGRRIAFTRGFNVMRSVRPDGTGLRRLAPVHGYNPVHAPDGKRIAFVKSIQHDFFSAEAIFTMSADGRGRTRTYDTATDRYGGIFASELDWQPRPPRAPTR